jgi:hypothetical protein
MSPTDPSSAPASGTGEPALDCFRYTLDDGVEQFVAQEAEGEAILASMRLQPVREAPLAMLRRLGVGEVPSTDGSWAQFAARPDAVGLAALAELTVSAVASRPRDPAEAFWLASCPDALLPTASALGWRPLAEAGDEADRTPVVLLLDDAEHLRRIGSPLADVLAALEPRPEVLNEQLALFDLRNGDRIPRRAAG